LALRHVPGRWRHVDRTASSRWRLLVMFGLACLSPAVAQIPPQNSAICTLAGYAGNNGWVDGFGREAHFSRPRGIAVDNDGNVYVADEQTHVIRKITATGAVSTVAGSPYRPGNTDGAANTALFNNPCAVAVDDEGNVYVADSTNSTIRRIGVSGVVSTLAGMARQYGSDDGVGSRARFRGPAGVAVDQNGTVYVADTGNRTVRRISRGGLVTTLAGAAGQTGTADGVGALARFSGPQGIGVSQNGSLFVTDQHAIRMITPAGAVTTVAGSITISGHTDDSGTAARFYYPGALAVFGEGIVYVADTSNNTIRRMMPDGSVTTVAGRAGAFGWVDGNGPMARFNEPAAVAVDTAGNLYVADAGSNTIRVGSRPIIVTHPASQLVPLNGSATFSVEAAESDVTYQWSVNGAPIPGATSRTYTVSNATAAAAGNYAVTVRGGISRETSSAAVLEVFGSTYPDTYTFSTIAGQAGEPGSYGGTAAKFNQPGSLAADPAGNIYVVDAGNHVVRKISPNGVVSTVAGAAGQSGNVDGVGAAVRFGSLRGITATGDGTLYVTEISTVRRISAGGIVQTIAGVAGELGSADGPAATARFNYPLGIVRDGSGSLYVADGGNSTIRKITRDGVVTTLAGSAGKVGCIDGKGADARFSFPHSLVLDAAGNLYVSDGRNWNIRKVTPGGEVRTFAGPADHLWDYRGHADGTGTAARFAYPAGVGMDGAGQLYVADSFLENIRKITPAGVVSTLTGSADYGYSGGYFDGTTAAAQFTNPAGLAVDATGNVYVSDPIYHAIRKISPAGVVSTLAGQPGYEGAADSAGPRVLFGTPLGVAVDDGGNVFVADAVNHTVQKLTPGGVAIIAAGRVQQTPGAMRSLSTYLLASPMGVAIDGSGRLLVADTGDSIIRTIDKSGALMTIAGTPGYQARRDGIGADAYFDLPQALAAAPNGDIYVADTSNRAIRRITSAGAVTTVSTSFLWPTGIATGPDGAVYVADPEYHSVFRIKDGVVSLFAGSGSPNRSGSEDGSVTSARFSKPRGLAVDSAGGVYVADTGNHTIRRIADGTVVTLGGLAGVAGTANGSGPDARFKGPAAIAIGPGGALYVADTDNRTLRKGALVAGAAPRFVFSPRGQAGDPGATIVLTAATSGTNAVPFRWQRNGTIIPNATGAALTLLNLSPTLAGLYHAEIGTGAAKAASAPAVVGLSTVVKVLGDGREVQTDVKHPNGNTFDQVLLTGVAEAITAEYDKTQITRTSFVDVDGDIVQVEFSGPGTLSLVLDGASDPAVAANYNQPGVQYVKGHAGIVIVGADERTNVSVFSVGRATAVNQALFKEGVKYDGIADIAFIAILSTNGKFGGVRTANANYFASQGYAGLYAPGVEFTGPVYIGDVSAFDSAKPVIVLGAASDVRITGGDLLQSNGQPVQVSGIARMQLTEGSDSHGNLLLAQTNRAILQQGGVDVTKQFVSGP
jgi:sugar lactone lactonase YvrE